VYSHPNQGGWLSRVTRLAIGADVPREFQRLLVRAHALAHNDKRHDTGSRDAYAYTS
jgi:hypothetical protein